MTKNQSEIIKDGKAIKLDTQSLPKQLSHQASSNLSVASSLPSVANSAKISFEKKAPQTKVEKYLEISDFVGYILKYPFLFVEAKVADIKESSLI